MCSSVTIIITERGVMGLEERLALAVGEDDLGWSDHKSKPVELVAALSAATNLGSDIHRSKGADLQAMRRAVLLLTKKAIDKGRGSRLPLSRVMAQAMSVTALFERCAPHCRTCNGAAVLVVNSLKVVCDTCGGAGIHRYSDKERARLCGIKPMDWPQWSARYQMVLKIAVDQDRAPQDAAEHWG